MKHSFLKLCVLSIFALMGCGLGKGPNITPDGFKMVECIAAHYPELANASNLVNVATIVAEQCGAESAQVVIDVFGGMHRGLARAGVKVEK